MPKSEHKTGLFIDINFDTHTLTLHSEKRLTEWELTPAQALGLGEWLIEQAIKLIDFERTQVPPGKTYHPTDEGTPGKNN